MRDIPTAFKTLVALAEQRVGVLCEIMYPDTPVRAWTGLGDLTWDGKTWKGLGDLAGISAIQERTGPQAGTMKLSLTAVAPEMRAIALANASAGCAVSVWLALFDETDGVWSVVADPWLAFSGISDVHRIAASILAVPVAPWLSRLKQPKISRYTHQEQQRYFPGDMFFVYASEVQNIPLYWGSPTPVGALKLTPPPPQGTGIG